MKVVCTIEARMRSTRLPGKVLLPILGRPMLEHMVERLRRSRRIDQVVVATTDQRVDDPVADLARRLPVGLFRGSETDVLDRVLRAARSYGADLIVETTGDCPVIDPEILDQVVDKFIHDDVDYCSNGLQHAFPRGLDVQVFPLRVLEEVARRTQDPADREHVTLYIYEHPGRFRLSHLESDLSADERDLRLTVDTPEDFALVKVIFEELYPTNPAFALADILSLVRRRPELVEFNRHIKQKAAR